MKNKGNIGNIIKTALSGILAVSFMALTGCASAPVKVPTAFFPPAPEEPRLQYLKGISGARDVEQAETGVSHSLKVFATGDEGETKPIGKPYGLRYVNGKLYVCDLGGHAVIIIDPAKNSFTAFEGKGTGKLKKPLNVAVDKDGSLWVVDAGRNNQVIHFDGNGDFVDIINVADVVKAPAEGQTLRPKAVDAAVDETSVYILDMISSDIKVYDKKSSKYVRTIGSYTEGKGGLSMPSNMTIGPDNLIYVTNMASGSVVILSKDDKIVSSFGKLGDGFGEFARPKGIAVGADNRIWAVDGGLQNVQLFQGDEKHRLLISVGDPGLPQGSLNLPAGIALTADASSVSYWQQFAVPGFTLEEIAFVSNQAGPAKLSIYGLGHRVKPADEKKEVATK